MERKDYILNRVEQIVCMVVNDAMDTFMPKNRYRVAPDELYSGATNIPFAKKLARGVCFCVFHERFSLSYAEIAFRSGISRRNVIRSSSVLKNMPFDDKMVRTVEANVTQMINEKLS